jgi:hypothetical protein
VRRPGRRRVKENMKINTKAIRKGKINSTYRKIKRREARKMSFGQEV